MDVAGNMIYFTGVTQSADFLQNTVPQNTGVFYSMSGVTRPFIAKLNIDTNQFEYVSYFNLDVQCTTGGYYHILTGRFASIRVDAGGNVYAGGANPRPFFPTVNAIDTELTGTCSRTTDIYGNVTWYHPIDGFLVKLNPTGTQLLYASYLGGLYEDVVTDIAIDENNNIYAAGYTDSDDMPRNGVIHDPSYNGGTDIFVTKINSASGAQAYFSYLGGASLDDPYGIALGQDSSLYVTGRTASSGFPTVPPSTGCSTCSSYTDGFALKVDPTGGLEYSRFLSGNRGELGSSIAVDQNNRVFISGYTNSTDFPSATTKTDIDAFMLELDANFGILQSNRFGGTSSDFGYAIAVDSSGKIYIVGETYSLDFPKTPNAYDLVGDTYRDLFITKIDPLPNSIMYSTYLGGRSAEVIDYHVVVNEQGEVYLQVSQTLSDDFPTKNAFDSTFNTGGSTDMMLVKFATNVMPLENCSGAGLSAIGQAVLSDVSAENQNYCFNAFDHFTFIEDQATGRAAYEEFAELARNANYEVDFTTMIWEQQAGDIILDGVRDLYQKVSADPTKYSQVVRVRILLGVEAYLPGLLGGDQRHHVLDSLTAMGVPLEPPNLPWKVEVASYRNSPRVFDVYAPPNIHSHVKLMIADGNQAIASGYNVQNLYINQAMNDLGIKISGPIVKDSLKVFDELWYEARGLRCKLGLNCTFTTEALGQIPHALEIYSLQPVSDNPTHVFSLFRNHDESTVKIADVAIPDAMRASSTRINLLQHSFFENYPPKQYCPFEGVCFPKNWEPDSLPPGEKGPFPYADAVIEAALSGVEVRMLLSASPDIKKMNTTSLETIRRHLYSLGPAGVTAYSNINVKFAKNYLHAKAVSVDGKFVVVGSQNFDFSAYGRDTRDLMDLAEYSFGVDSETAATQFNTEFDALWTNGVDLKRVDQSIQQAINEASPGAVVFIPSGTYQESIVVDKPVVLVGEDENQTIIQPAGNQPGIQVRSSDTEISNLRISGGDGYGIELVDSSPNSLKNILISRVILENNVQGGVLAQGLIPGSPMNYSIENNTFIGGNSGVSIDVIGTQANTSFIRNNIFAGQAVAPINILSSDDSHVEYSYNLFDNCGAGSCAANWKLGNMGNSSSTHDNLFDLDPLFTRPESGIYTLAAGSPAIDAGDPNMISEFVADGDNDGTARIDIGVVEYIPSTNAAPVVNAGDDQTVNLGSSVTVNATYSDADNQEDHFAYINWGDGVVEAVPVNTTGPGTGDVNAQHTHSDIGNYTVQVCVIDFFEAVGCDTLNIEVVSPSNPTYTPTSTLTPTPTSTNTPTNTPTFTPTSTSTNTPTSTPTFTPTSTATATNTMMPVSHTLVLQPDFSYGIDTFIYSSSATSNYGMSPEMGVGEDSSGNNRVARSLIKFDLSSIPANATVTSATLSLWTSEDSSSNTRMIRVYRLKKPFNDTQATWNIAATGVNWQTAGASGTNDRESVDIGSVQILATEPLNIQKQIPLSLVMMQEFVTGTFSNNGFIIVADTENNDQFKYYTSDSTNASWRPKLIIVYTVPATPICASPTPGEPPPPGSGNPLSLPPCEPAQ